MTECPICGAKNTLAKRKNEYTASYGNAAHSVQLDSYECSCCGATLDLDFEEKNELAIKNAMEAARAESVSDSLKHLENVLSFVELERSFALPPKTLSKWKNKSKSPSAAAAALVSLLGVFPWLSYVGMLNYNPKEAYKIAFAAILQKAKENPENFILPLTNEMYNGIALVHQNNQAYNDSYTPLSSKYSENLKSSTIEYKEASL
jgi:DNA-binding transcriptional regulator YiaG